LDRVEKTCGPSASSGEWATRSWKERGRKEKEGRKEGRKEEVEVEMRERL